MTTRTAVPTARYLLLSLALLGLSAAIVVSGAWIDRSERTSGPELPLRAYASAIAREDLLSALDCLIPPLRTGAVTFVEHQLGNDYAILESVVWTESAASRLTGGTAGATRVVATMEIQEADATWRATEELPVQQVDGRWLLAKVPLQPVD